MIYPCIQSLFFRAYGEETVILDMVGETPSETHVHPKGTIQRRQGVPKTHVYSRYSDIMAVHHVLFGGTDFMIHLQSVLPQPRVSGHWHACMQRWLKVAETRYATRQIELDMNMNDIATSTDR